MKQLPQFVDPRKLAHKGAVYDAVLPAKRLERLVDATNGCTDFDSSITFDIDASGFKTVKGTLKGTLTMTCQRCLQDVDVELDVAVNLAVVWDEEESLKLPKSLEPWIVGEESEPDLHSILEEELLLNMPIVASHSHQCIAATLMSAGDEVAEIAREQEEKENPFNVLKALKSKNSS